MDKWVLVIGLGVIVAVGIIIVRYYFGNRKIRAEIIDSIGKVPKPRDITYADDYWSTYRNKLKVTDKVDDHTWKNLDMDEVYQLLNACWCEAGDILLYKRLRLQASAADIERQEKLNNCFSRKPDVLHDVLYCLKSVGRGNYHTMKAVTLAPEELDSRWKTIAIVLALLPFCCLFIYPISQNVSLISVVVSLAVNFLSTFILKSKNTSYRMAYPMSNLLHWSKKIIPYVQECDTQLAEQISGCLAVCKKTSLPFFFMRYSDICEKIGLPDILGFFLIPILSYHYIVRFAQKETEGISKLYSLIGEIDIACAVFSFRKSLPYWVKPDYINAKRITAKAIYHPLLENAVANDIDTSKGVLLTGSNASGKSTFIKALALNAILAQSINTSCAKEFHIKKSNVITAMAVSDSIVEGDSYFIAEIKAMKRLVLASDAETFCYLFIDEILKGTNTIERIGAAASFLDYFDKQNILCFAASHDIELVFITSPEYAQYHFTENFDSGEIQFSYQLQDGPIKTRNAIRLLKVLDFPERITSKANKVVKLLEKGHAWKVN